MHYQTQHLVARVKRNSNNLALLYRQGDRPANTDPVVPEELVPRLDQLFNDGAYLALETMENWDDEGGECYQAFIVDPAWRTDFLEVTTDQFMKDPESNPNLKYVADYPNRFWILWAGPW